MATVLVACARSSAAPSEAFVSDAVDAMLLATWVTPSQATCLVAGQVDVLGFDNLVAAGVTPEEISGARIHALSKTMTGSQRSAMIRIVPECGIVWSAWFSGGSATEDQGACADRVATNEQLTETYAVVVAVDPAPQREAALVDAYVAFFQS